MTEMVVAPHYYGGPWDGCPVKADLSYPTVYLFSHRVCPVQIIAGPLNPITQLAATYIPHGMYRLTAGRYEWTGHIPGTPIPMDQ